MRCKWRAGASNVGIRGRNGNWLRKSLKSCLQELSSECLLREESVKKGKGCVSSSYGFMNPGTKAPSEKAFICCPVQCVFWEALVLCICWKRNTIYQCQGCLVSNIVRLQSESPWSNGNSLSYRVNLFYDRPPLPMDISQPRLLTYAWDVRKSLMHGRKRDF